MLAVEDLKLRVHDLDFTANDLAMTFIKFDLDKIGLITHSMFLVSNHDRSLLSDDVCMRFFQNLNSL